MTEPARTRHRLIQLTLCVGFLLLAGTRAQAQTVLLAADETQLRDAITLAASDPGTAYTISLSASITLTLPLPDLQAGTGGLIINGNGNTLSGVGGSLFVVQIGTVAIENLQYADGTTALATGTLLLNAGDSLGTGGVVLDDGTLQSGNSISVANAIDLTGSTTVDTNGFATTLTGALTGTGSLNKIGTGTLTLGGTQSYTGTTAVSAGTLQLTAANALVNSEGVAVDSFATLDFANTSQTLNALALVADSTVSLGTGTLTLESPIAGFASSLFGSVTGTGGLIVNGADTLVFIEGQQAYTGGTTVNGGFVDLAVDDALDVSSAVAVNGGQLIFGGNQTVSALSGSGGLIELCNCITLTVNQSSSTLFSGEVIGSGSLTKSGIGTLSLGFDNVSFLGNTTVTGGVVGLGADNSLGTGDVTLDGGGLQSDAAITVANAVTIGASGGNWNTNGNDTTLLGDLRGAGAFTKTGGGALVLAGNNGTFAGDTTVTGGVVALTANDSLGTGGLTLDGGGARSDGSLNVANNITFGLGGGTWDTTNNFTLLSGDLSGLGGLTKEGSGTLALGGLTNSYAGGTTINGGIVALGADNSLGTGGVTMNGGDIRSDAAITVANGFTFLATGTWDTNGNDTTVTGDLSGTGGFSKIGTGTLTLSGSNSYTGTTFLFDGTLRLGAAGALASSEEVSVNAFATLEFANNLQTIQALSILTDGTVDVGSGRLTLESPTGTASLIDGVITGTGGVTVDGALTQVVVRAQQTYTGETIVNDGLMILQTNDALAAGVVTVNGGELQIDGNQTVTALSGTGGVIELCNCITLTVDQSTSTSYDGEIFGFGSLVKTGSGTLALNFDNTSFSGTTLVTGGAVALGADNSLGLGNVTLDGGELRSGAAIGVMNAIEFGAGGGTWNTNGNDTTLFNDLTGAGAFTKNGGGTLTLNGFSNSWAGGTTVNDGVLLAGNAGTLIDNSAFVVNGGTLDLGGFDLTASSLSGIGGGIELGAGVLTVDQSANTTFAGTISGIGDLFKGGAGTLTLSSAHTHFGLTGVVGGTLRVTAADAFANNEGVVVGASALLDLANTSQTLQALVIDPGGAVDIGTGTLTIDGTLSPNFTTLYGAITGTGGLVLNGSSTTVFTDAQQTYTGGTTINDGVMFLGVNDTLVTSSALTINGGGVIIEANQTIGSLSGLGGFINLCFCGGELTVNQSTHTTFAGDIGGDGLLTKSGAGTLVLTGNVFHDGGTTVTGGRLQLGTTSVTTAELDGDVNVQAGGALGGTGTITGTVNFAAGATLAPGASIGTLTTGTLVLDSSSVLDFEFGAPGISDRVIVNGDLTLAGTLNVIDAGGFGAGVYRLFDYSGLFTDGGLVIGATPSGVSASLLQLQTSVTNQVNLISSWSGANASGPALAFWDGAGPAGNGVIDGGSGVWSATAPRWTDAAGTASSANAGGAFAIFQGTAGTVTVDNSEGAISVSGMQFATNGYEVTGGALTLAAPLTPIRVGNGTAAGGGMIATISAPLAGNGGVLKSDFGTLVLSGNNTYSGETQIDAGTLRLGSATALGTSGRLTINSGVLDLGGFSLGLKSIEGTGTVALAGGALTLGVADASSTFAGRLTGNGLFTKTGSGVLTLSGANAHSGETHVDSGTLAAGAANVFGAASAVSIGAGATLDLNNFSQAVGSLSGNGVVALAGATLTTGIDGHSTTYNGSIIGTGSVIKTGGGTWTLAGTNSYSGATLIDAGTLRLGSTGALGGTTSITIAGGGTLDLNGFSSTFGALGGTGRVALGSASLTLGAGDVSSLFGGSISGAGSLRKTGTGALRLSGAQSYTGGTFIDSGALLGDTTSLRGAIANDAIVVFEQPANGLFNGTMTGRGGLIKRDGGVLTLAGRQAYSGGTLVSGGTLQGTTESLQGTITVDTALRFEHAFNGLFTGLLMGTGTLAKAGAGTLTLTGNHPISGGATVEAGALWLDGSLGGSVTVRNGARFISGAIPTATASLATADAAVGRGKTLTAREAWMTAAADTNAVGALGRTHIAGDLVLQPGSTYEASVNAVGDSALLSSGGTVIAGGATIVLEGDASEFPRVLQTAIITTVDGILGQPAIQASPGLDASLTSDGQSLFLTVLNNNALLAPGTAILKGNAAAVGSAFDRLRSTAAGDLASVTRELAALSDAGLATALDGASGEIFATSMHVAAIDAEATADRIRGEVARRRRPTTSALEPAGAVSLTATAPTAWGHGRRFWGQMGGERARLDATAGSHAADGYVGGFAIGVDWASAGGWLAGGGGGYALGQMKLTSEGHNADTAAPRAFGYAGYARGRWTLNGGGTIGRTSYDTERHMAFVATLDPRFGSTALFTGIDRTATSTSHGVDTSGWLEARVALMRGAWLLQPGVGVRTARYGRAAVAEAGAGALSFSAPDQAIRSSQFDAGLQLGRQSGRVRPTVSASYRRELGDGATSLTLQLSPDAAGRFTISGAPFATSRVLGSLGLAMDRFWFGYGIDAASGQTRQTVNFGVAFE